MDERSADVNGGSRIDEMLRKQSKYSETLIVSKSGVDIERGGVKVGER